MRGLTDYITCCPWVDVLTTWFVLVDDAYQQLVGPRRLRQRGPAPVFSDSEVITLSLLCDAYFHGKEELMLTFVRQYHRDLFPHVLSLGRFNRRRRAALGLLEGIRCALRERLIAPGDALRLIDSAPIPVCTYARGRRCRTVSGPEYCSVMPSRRAKLFGFRVQLTVTDQQVVDQWLLAPAAPRDSKVAAALLAETDWRLVYGDNAFRDPSVARVLAEKHHVELQAPPRRYYDRVAWPRAYRQLFNRMRRRVESALSVLAVCFHLEQPGSRSLSGLLARVATRILAYTISFIAAPMLMPDLN